ncbi:hypothetical protein F5Y10DRAFT_254568 [Nemania abortiva]|nr:hypothetical protein F5Y10DRAFT_254568 [Nemania abortiva]
MYITKLFVPAMLVLSGLSQARPAGDEGAIEAQGDSFSLLTATANLALVPRQDPDSSDPDQHAQELDARDEDPSAQDLSARAPAPEPQRPRPWCRDDEYWDRFWRRCRRYPPFPRPRCRFGERPYCGRGRRDWVPYDESNPFCRRRSGYSAFCARPGRESDVIAGGGD